MLYMQLVEATCDVATTKMVVRRRRAGQQAQFCGFCAFALGAAEQSEVRHGWLALHMWQLAYRGRLIPQLQQSTICHAHHHLTPHPCPCLPLLCCSVIAAPLAARQAAHDELFGRPCRCSRCSLEATLPQETVQQLQALHAAADSEWPQRLQAALEGAEEADPEETAELLAELQVGLGFWGFGVWHVCGPGLWAVVQAALEGTEEPHFEETGELLAELQVGTGPGGCTENEVSTRCMINYSATASTLHLPTCNCCCHCCCYRLRLLLTSMSLMLPSRCTCLSVKTSWQCCAFFYASLTQLLHLRCCCCRLRWLLTSRR